MAIRIPYEGLPPRDPVHLPESLRIVEPAPHDWPDHLAAAGDLRDRQGAAHQRQEVRRLLSQVSLPTDYETRYPAQLSGGERQRVAIARALAARPRVLICDEITSALDVSIQASVLELLVKLRIEENLSLLFITHHIGVVRAIADSVVVLQNGVVVEAGSADQVLDSPKHPYTKMLLRDTLVMPEAGSLDAGSATAVRG